MTCCRLGSSPFTGEWYGQQSCVQGPITHLCDAVIIWVEDEMHKYAVTVRGKHLLRTRCIRNYQTCAMAKNKVQDPQGPASCIPFRILGSQGPMSSIHFRILGFQCPTSSILFRIQGFQGPTSGIHSRILGSQGPMTSINFRIQSPQGPTT